MPMKVKVCWLAALAVYHQQKLLLEPGVGECSKNRPGHGASVKVFDNDIYRLKRMQNNIGVHVDECD